jgi:hypothetical protein
MLLGAPCLFATTAYIMGYTPAGGVTVNSGGGPVYQAPALFSYSNFNSSAYQSLYYGVNYVANVAQVGSPTGNMAFGGVTGNGSLAWGSTVNWTFIGGTCGAVSIPTQLVVQIQPLTGTPGFLSSGALSATATKGGLGITTGSPGDPLYQVVGSGSAANFQITFQFLTWDGNPADFGSGQDLADYYANCGGGSSGTFATSVDFEFWWNVPKTTSKTVQVGTCKTNLPNYATIQTAISAVPAGATVQICPNTYNEQLTITAPITIQGIASGTKAAVVLNPPGVMEQNGSLGPYAIFAQILVQDAGTVNISGLTIDGNGSGCPAGILAGVVYLSASTPTSGKFTNSVIRNTGNGCGQGQAFYAENGSGSAATLTLTGNSIHDINGGAIGFGANVGGTISSNTIVNASSGLSFDQAGPAVKASTNTIVETQNGISLNSATGVVAQGNQIVNTTGDAISLHDNTGGSNTVTKNVVNETNCGISTSGAAATDVYFPNTVLNANMTTCN